MGEIVAAKHEASQSWRLLQALQTLDVVAEHVQNGQLRQLLQAADAAYAVVLVTQHCHLLFACTSQLLSGSLFTCLLSISQ